jgi:hypothetical protein
MPESFYRYLGHAIMQNVQMRLWEEAQISTKSVKGVAWDHKFPKDIKTGFDKAMKEYESIVKELESA